MNDPKGRFEDYFGSTRYEDWRPKYPTDFYHLVTKNIPKMPCEKIVDVGCGSGQATYDLIPYGKNILGIDMSPGQIERANNILLRTLNSLGDLKIQFELGRAESIPTADASVNLITAAQCIHWFDLGLFFEEAKRVLAPDGVLAFWCYLRPKVTNNLEVEQAFEKMYSKTLGEFWPPSRKEVESKYAHISPPFTDVERIETSMEYELDANGILGYVSTWSSLQVAKKHDPERDWSMELRSVYV